MNKNNNNPESKEGYLRIRYRLTFLMSLGFVMFGAGFLLESPTNLLFWSIGGVLALIMTAVVIVMDRKTKVKLQEISEFATKKNPFNKNKYK